jgi:hypothetical protein
VHRRRGLLTNSDWWGTRLRLADQRLQVVLGGGTSSEIDTRSLSLLAPGRTGQVAGADTATPPSKIATRPRSETIGPAFPIAVASLLLAGAVITVMRRFGRLSRRAPAR